MAHPGGAPTKLTNELIEMARLYVLDNDTMNPTSLLPTIERLALILDVSRDTLYEWEKENKEFSDILRRLRNSQADKLLQSSLIGRYNAVISKLMLSKHGYVEKTELDAKVQKVIPILGGESNKQNTADEILGDEDSE